MKEAFAILGVIALLVGLGWALTFNSLQQQKVFAPKFEENRRKVFEQSQTYNEGMIRDLEEIQRQYMSAAPDERNALRAIAIHRFEVYGRENLPPNLQLFLTKLETNQ